MKLWNGAVKLIEIFEKRSNKRIASFSADDVTCTEYICTFYMNGKELYKCDNSCYYKSYDL